MGKKAILGLIFTLFSLMFLARVMAQSSGPSNDFSFNVGSANVGDTVTIFVQVNANTVGAVTTRTACGGTDKAETSELNFEVHWNTSGCASGPQNVQVCSRAADDTAWQFASCTTKSVELIAVPVAIPAPDANLWAEVSSLIQGQCSAIHWNTANAHTIVVDGQNVGASGTMQVCPDVTKTYTLNAYGDGGEARREVQILVNTLNTPVPPPQSNPSNGSSLPDGTALETNDGRVFIVCGGQLHHLPNEITMDRSGYTRNMINRSLTNDQILAIPMGSDIPDFTRDEGSFWEFKNNCFPEPTPIVHPGDTNTNTSSASNSSGSDNNCPSVGTNLAIGQIAVVSDFDPNPLHVFDQVGTNEIFTIPIREQLSIVSGPVCADGRLWWQIGYNGRVGWAVGTTRNNMYNLIPNGQPLPGSGDTAQSSSSPQSQSETTTSGNTNSSDSNCSGAKAPRLSVGSIGTVPAGGDGDSVSLRNEPQGGTIGQINQGQTFTVISGPVCTEAIDGHLNWYQVRIDNGTIGWVPEGYDHSAYWVEPIGSASSDSGTVLGDSTSSATSILDQTVDSLKTLDTVFTIQGDQPITGDPVTDNVIRSFVGVAVNVSDISEGIETNDSNKISAGSSGIAKNTGILVLGLVAVSALSVNPATGTGLVIVTLASAIAEAIFTK